jgi:hypothetical protein
MLFIKLHQNRREGSKNATVHYYCDLPSYDTALQSDRWVQHFGGIFPTVEFHLFFHEDG